MDAEEQHILDGLGEDIFFKTEVVKSLALIHQIAQNSAHPEMLKYVRNRLSEPYKVIQKRLGEMGEYENTPNQTDKYCKRQ